MEVYVIETGTGKDYADLIADFESIGNVNLIPKYGTEDSIQNALPLTHIERVKNVIQTSGKIQNIRAWDHMIQNSVPDALIVIDTVRVNNEFVKNNKIPPGGDIGILAPSNLRIVGIRLVGTEWAYMDTTEDPYANNICNAYTVTLDAAKGLYERRNELLNSPQSFAQCIKEYSGPYSYGKRLTSYISMATQSTKPVHLA